MELKLAGRELGELLEQAELLAHTLASEAPLGCAAAARCHWQEIDCVHTSCFLDGDAAGFKLIVFPCPSRIQHIVHPQD